MSKKNGKWVVGLMLLVVALLSLVSVMIQSRVDRKGPSEETTEGRVDQ